VFFPHRRQYRPLEIFMQIHLHTLVRLIAGSTVISMISPLALADQTVLIGEASPLTGQIAHLGKDMENGATLAVEEINTKGLLIGGEKVTLRLDAQDDSADPRTATQVAQKLVDDKVVAVIGHFNSGTSIPASRIYNEAGITQIAPSATNPKYTQQGFKTTFRLVATDAQQGPGLAAYVAKQMKVKTVAIVDDSTAYGQGLAIEFEKAAKALGVTVLSHDATSDKAIDYRAILTKIKGENPDAIMYGGDDAGGGPLARQAMQLGIKAKIVAGDGVCTEKLSDLAGDAADNVVCSVASKALEKMPGGQAFQTKYIQRFGQPTQSYGPLSYDAVYVIANAIKKANSTDPAKVLAAMPATRYDGVIGQILFDDKGDLQHGTISFFNYKAGKKTLLGEVKL